MSCPSSILRRDSNPRPFIREPPPITTRPGLPFVTCMNNPRWALNLHLHFLSEEVDRSLTKPTGLVDRISYGFLKKWADSGLFLFTFVLFSLQFQYKLKKHRWCAWDSNPWPQDGRRRQNHGAMATTMGLVMLPPTIKCTWALHV